MSRPVQSFVMVMLGATLIRLVVTGAAADYVRPALGPDLVAAGVLFAVLGVLGIVKDLGGDRARRAAAAFRQEARVRTHGPGARSPQPSGHSHHGWHGHGVGWLLAAPLLLLLASPPPALGSYSAGRTDARVPRPVGRPSYAPLPATDPAPLPIRDYATRAVWDHGRTLAGRRITLIGFVAPTVDSVGPWYIARLHIVCCAADAQTAKVAVAGFPARFPTGQWVSVTGTWTAGAGHDLDSRTAEIRASTVRPIPPPRQPYE